MNKVISKEESPEVMRHAAQSLADALPEGQYRTLKGQGHDLVPAVVGPELAEFFASSGLGAKKNLRYVSHGFP